MDIVEHRWGHSLTIKEYHALGRVPRLSIHHYYSHRPVGFVIDHPAFGQAIVPLKTVQGVFHVWTVLPVYGAFIISQHFKPSLHLHTSIPLSPGLRFLAPFPKERTTPYMYTGCRIYIGIQVSTSLLYILTHPWEALYPIVEGLLVPCIP